MRDDTIWAREPHTGIKHEIYDGYLDAWLPIILQSFPSATYAEGYAGPGIYTGREPGSPIRALQRLFHARETKPHLARKPARFVLVEKRADRVECLLERLRRLLRDPMPGGEYRDPFLHVVVRKGACEKVLPEALDQLGAWDAPVLAVLDSFGGGNTQTLLRRFATSRSCEVVVTVEPQHFVRNLDPERADVVFGTQDWRAVDNLCSNEKRAFISEQLVHAIRRAGFQYVVTFGLESTAGGELLLQFGSNHVRGLERFKDSLWKADPISGARFRDPTDPDQLLFDFVPEPGQTPLRRVLLNYLKHRPGRTATMADLRAYTLEHTVYREPHTNPALEQLRANGEITTRPEQKRITSHTRKTVAVTATDGQQFDLLSLLASG